MKTLCNSVIVGLDQYPFYGSGGFQPEAVLLSRKHLTMSGDNFWLLQVEGGGNNSIWDAAKWPTW